MASRKAAEINLPDARPATKAQRVIIDPDLAARWRAEAAAKGNPWLPQCLRWAELTGRIIPPFGVAGGRLAGTLGTRGGGGGGVAGLGAETAVDGASDAEGAGGGGAMIVDTVTIGSSCAGGRAGWATVALVPGGALCTRPRVPSSATNATAPPATIATTTSNRRPGANSVGAAQARQPVGWSRQSYSQPRQALPAGPPVPRPEASRLRVAGGRSGAKVDP